MSKAPNFCLRADKRKDGYFYGESEPGKEA